MDKKYIRHMWSHESVAHRFVVKKLNRLLAMLPFRLKYSIGKRIRRNKIPYSLLKEGHTVVQIGAPKDTLASGRSRAMYFSLFVGKKGKTIIMEPDNENVLAYQKACKIQAIDNIIFFTLGAWSEKKDLELFIDPKHPASNFVSGTKSFSPSRMREYTKIKIPVDTLDNITNSLGFTSVDMVSITTNGSEVEILKGMRGLIDKGVKYICLARTGSNYKELMKEYGYELISYDDRGYTFAKSTLIE